MFLFLPVEFYGGSTITSDFVWILKRNETITEGGSFSGVNNFYDTGTLNCGYWEGIIIIRNKWTNGNWTLLMTENKYYPECW